jgi:hypothetical protein
MDKYGYTSLCDFSIDGMDTIGYDVTIENTEDINTSAQRGKNEGRKEQ